jgi:hypothetical protein
MNQIQGFTDQPKQKTTLILADGTSATLTLEYKPQQIGWFYDLVWQNFALNGQRLTASPNILYQFHHQLSFGLMVITAGNVEPTLQTDLSDGTTSIYLLEGTDVADVAAAVFGP